MTREEGIEIQKAQLADWKLKLKESVYKKLEQYVDIENSLLYNDNGYVVKRGVDLDMFIKNIEII